MQIVFDGCTAEGHVSSTSYKPYQYEFECNECGPLKLYIEIPGVCDWSSEHLLPESLGDLRKY